jgi:nucleotide-binding universal stress UspA family protein
MTRQAPVSGRRVVAGFDGSPGSWTALEYAVQTCRARTLRLRVVHAFAREPATPAVPDASAPARQRLAAAIRQIRERHPQLPVDGYVLANSPANMLINESATASLVVLGGCGCGSGAGFHHSMVCSTVAMSAHCPVVVVRGESRPGAAVVVGVDGKQPSPEAVAFAFDAASMGGVPLHALYAWHGPAAGTASSLLDNALLSWPDKYPNVALRRDVAPGRNAAEVLVAASGQASLVVIGPHTTGRLRALLPGATAHGLLHAADCPVAIVHPDRAVAVRLSIPAKLAPGRSAS